MQVPNVFLIIDEVGVSARGRDIAIDALPQVAEDSRTALDGIAEPAVQGEKWDQRVSRGPAGLRHATVVSVRGEIEK